MEYGSIFGHGAYLGPDCTADYLHRAALVGRRTSTAVTAQHMAPSSGRSTTSRPTATTPATGTLTYSAAQAPRLRRARRHYDDFFGDPTTQFGLRPNAIADPAKIKRADRLLRLDGLDGGGAPPGPQLLLHQQLAPRGAGRQHAHGDAIVWSALSLVALLGGIGLLFGGLRALGLPRLARPRAGDALASGARRGGADARPAGDRLVLPGRGGAVPAPDPGRRRVPALQGRDRRLLRHRPAQVFPYNLTRTWHVQLAHLLRRDVVPGRRDLPGADDRRARAARPGLARLRACSAALAVVVFGSLGGEFAQRPRLVRVRSARSSATQGLEYLDLGRFWQVLLVIGLFFWVAILYRGLRAAPSTRARRATCPGCSSSPPWRSRRSTRSACWRTRRRASPSPTSGGSGSSTSGSRTSSSCSRR